MMQKYVDLLNEGWERHLKKKASKAPTVISTFAGCGGSSLGYSMAGFRELLAVEWDKHAVAVFKANFPDVPVFHGDIARLSVEQCLEMAGIEKGELDVFDGSPPCQGFSTAGKRVLDDPRNSLFKEYVRLLRGLQPKVFVMENVTGLVKGRMKFVFVEILKELKNSGYAVSAKVLNAVYYGVPQKRQRVIFIGVRNDFNILPSHPKGKFKIVTVQDALFECKPSENYLVPGDNLKFVSMLPPGAKNNLKSKASQKIFGKPRNFNLMKLKWSEPAPTIAKTARISSRFGAGFVMPDENRYVSIAEAKRLSSFPDQFNFGNGKYEEKWARIGNSVPPFLLGAIASHIRKCLLKRQGK